MVTFYEYGLLEFKRMRSRRGKERIIYRIKPNLVDNVRRIINDAERKMFEEEIKHHRVFEFFNGRLGHPGRWKDEEKERLHKRLEEFKKRVREELEELRERRREP